MNQSLKGDHPDGAAQRRAWSWIALSLWACLVTVPISYLMAGHLVGLPVTNQAIALTASTNSTDWRILHILSEDCGCSRNVLNYLLERGKELQTEESVILVNGSNATRSALEQRGFHVILSNPTELAAQYGSEGVPFFQVTSPDNTLWYSGAYQDMRSRSSSRFLDLQLLAESQSGIRSNDLPVIGCATSERLKRVMDPLSLKYN